MARKVGKGIFWVVVIVVVFVLMITKGPIIVN